MHTPPTNRPPSPSQVAAYPEFDGRGVAFLAEGDEEVCYVTRYMMRGTYHYYCCCCYYYCCCCYYYHYCCCYYYCCYYHYYCCCCYCCCCCYYCYYCCCYSTSATTATATTTTKRLVLLLTCLKWTKPKPLDWPVEPSVCRSTLSITPNGAKSACSCSEVIEKCSPPT